MKKLLNLTLLIFLLLTSCEKKSEYTILKYDCSGTASQRLTASNKILFLFPNDDDSVTYKEQTSFWRASLARHKIECSIKYENQLLEEDLNKIMFIFGTINSFKNWEKLSIPITNKKNGFEFGGLKFNNKNDAILYIPDSTVNIMKFVAVGNSPNSLQPIVNNVQDGYNYFVYENGMITHFGSTSSNEYDKKKHVYLPKIKNNHYKKIKTKYYDFLVSKKLESKVDSFKTKLDSFDFFVSKYIKVMEVDEPKDKITCYIHSDNEEISYISTHFSHLCGGTTYGIVTGNEIHSLGFNGAIAHESSHIIFNSKYNKFPPTFFSEGIRQYYDYATNPDFLQDGIKTAQQFIEEDISPVILGHQNFFQGDKYYKISGVFVKYLIDKDGLDTFKKFYSKINARNIDASLHKTYSVDLETCMNNYRVWLKK